MGVKAIPSCRCQKEVLSTKHVLTIFDFYSFFALFLSRFDDDTKNLFTIFIYFSPFFPLSQIQQSMTRVEDDGNKTRRYSTTTTTTATADQQQLQQ